MSQAQAKALKDYALYLAHMRAIGAVGHRGGSGATKALLAACDLEPGQRVLEVGCGTGHTAKVIAGRYGASVIAVDEGRHLVDAALNRLQRKRLDAAVVQADGRLLPFADSSFDVLVCESVLAFLPDRATALAEFNRVLRPGGLLANNELTFIRQPPPDFRAALEEASAESGGSLLVPVNGDAHRADLEKGGFAIVSVRTSDAPIRRQFLGQIRLDGWKALRPLFESIFNRELRQLVYNREMAAAQRIFMQHTGYGLYLARKVAGATE